MASFQVPYVSINANSWGPPSLSEANTTSGDNDNSSTNAPITKNKFHLLPYAPFGRSDRIGRAADFTASYNNHQTWNNASGNKTGGGYNNRSSRNKIENEEFQYKVDATEQSSFQLVDNTKAASNKGKFVSHGAKRRQQQQQRFRQLNTRRPGGAGGSGTAATGGDTAGFQKQPQRTKRRNQWGRNAGGRGGRNWQNRVDRQASVSIRPDWAKVEEFDLLFFKKLKADKLPDEEDLVWSGFLDQYNENFDKVSTKYPTPLKRSETKEFYPVTTTDDPVIEKLAIDGAGNVFCTDAILAHIMASPRSVYPWDIVIQKLPDGSIFFDKRDSSQFDYLTVNETSNSPPVKNEDDPEDINNPDRLSLEATMIHQNFSQQILKSSKTRKEFDLPNPFWDEVDNEGMEPASVAFRYRRFTFPKEDIRIVVRCELHGYSKRKESPQYMTAFALNECPTTIVTQNPGAGNTGTTTTTVMNWRDKLDSQRGAVLATELKNNSCKLAKWTAQSLLAGAHQMKIGYVSRISHKNNYEHAILATQFYRPKDFATQITLNVNNMWGIIKMLVELMRKMDEGKYVFMREPNRPVAKLYKVPIGTFEDDEGDDEEEEEEEVEEVGGNE